MISGQIAGAGRHSNLVDAMCWICRKGLARFLHYTYCTRGSAPHAWLAIGTGTVIAFWGTAGSLGGDSRPYFFAPQARTFDAQERPSSMAVRSWWRLRRLPATGAPSAEKADARRVFRNRGDPWNRVPGVGQAWRRAPCRFASQFDAGCQSYASSPQQSTSASDGHHTMEMARFLSLRCIAWMRPIF